MSGSDHYRVVFTAHAGHTECKDVLIDAGTASEEVIRAALLSQHDIGGVEVSRFYEVPTRKTEGVE